MKYLKFILIGILFIGCNTDSSTQDNDTGQGGSTARFAIVGDYLYTVDDADLNVFSIVNTSNPVFLNKVPVGFRIETLFAYNNSLFIGSQNGMFIYNLTNPETPMQDSSVRHFTSCDPVVTDGNFAYVTLHSNSNCGNNINALDIFDVSDFQNPIQVHHRNMIHPKGLGLYNNYLIVCDDEVKIFDVTDPANMEFATSISVSGFDVIIQNNHLIVIAENGLFQYTLDSNDITNITSISSILF